MEAEVSAAEADPFWLIEAGKIWIKTKAGELVRLKPNRPQRRFLDWVRERMEAGQPIRVWILKARQQGFSTLCEAMIYCLTAQQPNRQALIMADEMDRTDHIFAMTDLAHQLLAETDPHLAPTTEAANARQLKFDRLRGRRLGSQIIVATAKAARKGKGVLRTAGVGRSITPQYVHLSECGSFDDLDGVLGGLMMSVPKPPVWTMVIGESTADMYGGQFHREIRRVQDGESDWELYFSPWIEHDEYELELEPGEIICLDGDEPVEAVAAAIGVSETPQTSLTSPEPADLVETRLCQVYGSGMGLDKVLRKIKWRRWCIKTECRGDADLFRREYPLTVDEAFLTAGRPRFNANLLRNVYEPLCREPALVGEIVWRDGRPTIVSQPGGSLSVWEEPDPRGDYRIGADVAENTVDGAYHSAHVIERRTGRVVAVYHNRRDPDLYGHDLNALGRWYNKALIGAEANSCGLTVLTALRRGDAEAGLAPYPNIYRRETVDRIDGQATASFGWRTTDRTKALMIDDLDAALRNRDIKIYDRATVSELMAYQVLDTGLGAPPGGHDDRVMSLALAVQMLAKSGQGVLAGMEIDLEAA